MNHLQETQEDITTYSDSNTNMLPTFKAINANTKVKNSFSLKFVASTTYTM